MNYEHKLLNLDASDASTESTRRWDELCAADRESLPTSRFEHQDLWYQTFAPRVPRQALVVTQNDRWVAALPVVPRRSKGLLPRWELPYSDWTPTSQLLVDSCSADDPQLYAALVRGLQKMGRPLLHIAELHQRPAAERLVAALERAGLRFDLALRYEIGQLNVRGRHAPANWAAYQKQLSGNFRRKIGKMLRRAESLGGLELQVVQPQSADDVGTWLTLGFAIEDRSWKGPAGCSALRTPGMVDYYRRQAELLAQRNELTLLFLQHCGQRIAFQYGWSVGRTYYSPKIGYDEAFAHLSPGHLLMHLWIERMFAEDQFDTFDFAGPVSDSTSGWITSTYRVERLWASTGWWGNRLLACAPAARAAKHWLQSRRQVVNSSGGDTDEAEVPMPKPDSALPRAEGTSAAGRQSKPDRRPPCPPILPSFDDNSLPADSTSVVP